MRAASTSNRAGANVHTPAGRGQSVPSRTKTNTHAATAATTPSRPAASAMSAPLGTCASTKGLASTSRLEVTPPVGEFINYDVDTTYVLRFTIRNRTPGVQVLRFLAPQKPHTPFRIVNMQAAKVAPGLSHTLEVEFATHVVNDVEDAFVVLNSNGDRLAIPLISRCVPAVEFDAEVNFGRVEHTNIGASVALKLVNRGRREATVSFTPASEHIVVRPPTTVVPALGKASVSFELAVLPPGPQSWVVHAAVEGEDAPKTVRAVVDVVDGRSKLIDPKTHQEAVSVSFERVYAGSRNRYELHVINGSDQAASFAFQLTNELAALEAPPFRFTPEQGRLGPKEVRKVLVEFAPPLNPARKGWSNAENRYASTVPLEPRKFEGLFSLLFVETEQVHHFHVHGESVDTQAWVTDPVLDFGSCEMNDYRELTMDIHNGVEELPLEYAIDAAANFAFKPAAGTVSRGGMRTVDVRFQPRRLGKFSEKVCVTFNGTSRQYVTLLAHSVPPSGTRRANVTSRASGVDRLPEDFVQPRKAPDAPRPGKATLTSSAESALRLTATGTLAAVDMAAACDIGMSPAEGLHPPQPSAKIPLRVLQAEDAAARNPDGSHVAPVQFDTKALIKRRYPEEPCNAMERRDCRRELMPMDLLKIISPIKLVDFGNITVGASSTKSFYVFNGSSASVMVSMPVEEPGLRFEPASQVIPTNRMAQFDVRFRSTAIQSCQQVVHYIVNHHHRMRFALHAEVIPVEVVVSQTEVMLNYAAVTESEEPSCRAVITLANNGNSPATYTWELTGEHASRFAVQPASGMLVPNSRLRADVVFTAPAGAALPQWECEARLTAEGAVQQKIVKLVGTVAAAKCTWSKRVTGAPQLPTAGPSNGGKSTTVTTTASSGGGTDELHVDLRRVPAGKPTTFTVEIGNRGTSNAFFSFEEIPEIIKISPQRGRVCHGEVEELTVTLCCERAETVNHTVTCFVRGMRKPLRLHLSAIVVAPPLSILYPPKDKGEVTLDYGEIYAQSQAARLLRFKNIGDVDAVVHVQLGSHANLLVRTPTESDRLSAALAAAPGDAWPTTNAFVRVEALAHPPTADGASSEAWPAALESQSSDEVSGGTGGAYLLTVPKCSEADVSFVFAPSSASRHERFYVRWRQIGADELHPLLPLVLSASACAPRLRLSTSSVTLPTVVAGQPPAPIALVVENLTKESLAWQLEAIGTEAATDSARPFLLEPANGCLSGRGRQTVQLRYLARCVGREHQIYHLVANNEASKPCRTLTVVAAARAPRVLCDHDVVRFPAVPLGVPVRATVFLINDGFESITVAYEGDSLPVLSVELPKGDVLSSGHPRIPVNLTFCSTHPLDLTSSICFSTDLGETVTLGITASANNSVLTTQPFLQYREGQVGVVATDVGSDAMSWRAANAQPFVLTDASHYSRAGSSASARAALQNWSAQPCCATVRFQPSPATDEADHATTRADDGRGTRAASSPRSPRLAVRDTFAMLDAVGSALTIEGTQFVPSSPRSTGGTRTSAPLSLLHLTRWLNITVFASPVADVLEALQQSHGSLLSDMIEHWFGKRPKRTPASTASVNTPGDADAEAQRSKGEVAVEILLSFMRTFGACLSTVDPIYLLPYQEYVTVCDTRRDVQLAHAKTTAHGSLSSVDAAADVVQQKHASPFVLPELVFQRRAQQAWCTVTLEAVRLFFLSRVTPSNAQRLDRHMEQYVSDISQWSSKGFTDALNTSNVYSAHESLLLHMVRGAVSAYRLKHSETASPASPFASTTKSLRQQHIRIDAFEDLRDARVLSMVVLDFVPDLHSFFYEGDRRIIEAPSTLAEHESNAQLLLSALAELGVPLMCTEREFVELAVVDAVLLCANVLWYLPKFIPTSTLRFEGRLLSTIRQSIDVRNASPTESRTYRISVDEPQFSLSTTELVVAPSTTVSFHISFCPRYMREVRGRCRVVETSSGVRLDDRHPLAVDLVVVPNTEPSKIIKVETPLYEPLHIDVPVVSPFATDCVVGLRLTQAYDATDRTDKEDTTKADPAAAPPALYPESVFVGQRYRSPFFVSADVLPLRRGETTRLPLQFIPLGRGTYTLHITFREEREGEFTYVIEGTCGAPKASTDVPVEFRAELEESATQTAFIRANNSSLERAVRLFEERTRQTRPAATWADPQELQRSVRRQSSVVATDLSAVQYHVDFVNDALEGPSPFFACEPDTTQSASSPTSAAKPSEAATCTMPGNGSPATLRFRFKPKYVGRYTGFILLTSPLDVRVVRLVGECVPKGERYQLQFQCPARQSITQDISIRNSSITDWLFTATLSGSESFHGVRELRVPAGKRREYTLKYSPPWLTEDDRGSTVPDHATLTLQNQVNGQKHAYTLTGLADAPLSEETIRLECKAREKTSITLAVPNVCVTDTTYLVETDMPFTVGEPHLVVPRGALGKYALTFSPTVGGTFEGRLIFRSPTGRYIWYTLELVAAPPEKEATVEIKTDVRTTVVADVTLTNPLDKPLVFDVRRYGAGLYGARQIELGAGESSVYSCTFTPAQVGTFDGRLSFCNEEVGEFWYALRMVVEDSNPEELFFETALGTTLSAQVRLPNPTDKDYRLTVHNDNNTNFSVRPPHITLSAHSDTLIEVVYKPTSIGAAELGHIALTHPQLGEWKYVCQGTGTQPEPFAEQSCKCEAGSSVNVTLPVTNTLGIDSEMEITLEEAPTADSGVGASGKDHVNRASSSSSSAFSVERGIDGALAAGASANVVLLYAPKHVGQSRVELVVRPRAGRSSAAHRVAWRYPISGCAEWRERAAKPFRFRCTARQQIEDTVLLPAPGLTAADRESCTIQFTPDARQHYVSAVTSTLSTTLDTDAALPDAMQLQVRFAPLRPLSVSGEWTLQSATGGAWRYRVYLEASPAPVDDTITLHCAHGESAAVTFDIHNVFPYKSTFAAYFALGSSKDLAVSPAQGVLMPFVMGQRPGVAAATTVRVSFAPSARVPQVEGLLVVDTEDMQWSFKVIGKMASSKNSKR